MWFFSLALWLLAVRQRFKAFDWMPMISAGLVALTASAGMAPICWILRAAVLTSALHTRTQLAVALSLVATVGAAVYLLLVLLLTRRHSRPADPADPTGPRDPGSLLETE
jgi:membrane protein implicated in regulation of membrane protease activity